MSWWRKLKKAAAKAAAKSKVEDPIVRSSDEVKVNWHSNIESVTKSVKVPEVDILGNTEAVEVIPTDVYLKVKVKKSIEPLDLMKVKFLDSPNKSVRKDDIRYIVLHHTGPGSFNGIVNWLINPDAKASAHYVVGISGQLKQLVNSGRKSWHAGISNWEGLSDINRYSIGIEIQNLGLLQKDGDDFYYQYGRSLKKYSGKTDPVFGKITYPDGRVLEGYYVPYPEKQINKVIALCKGLVKKYPQIKAKHIITHYQISPERKNDPFSLDLEYIREMVYDE